MVASTLVQISCKYFHCNNYYKSAIMYLSGHLPKYTNYLLTNRIFLFRCRDYDVAECRLQPSIFLALLIPDDRNN
jgi:hypothetical protein